MQKYLGIKRDTLDGYPDAGQSLEIENGKRYDLDPNHPEVQRASSARVESIRAMEEPAHAKPNKPAVVSEKEKEVNRGS
jgi:hypothetical protein